MEEAGGSNPPEPSSVAACEGPTGVCHTDDGYEHREREVLAVQIRPDPYDSARNKRDE